MVLYCKYTAERNYQLARQVQTGPYQAVSFMENADTLEQEHGDSS